MVWDDEFNGTFLNLQNWNYNAGAHRQAINTPDAVSVYDGTLKINTYTAPDGTIHSGEINTNGRYMPTYGYIEASIEFKNAPGEWPAFWLESSNVASPNPADGEEVDIFQYVWTQPNVNQESVIWDYGPPVQSTSNNFHITGLDNGFHTYGLLWTPTEYQFYIDGVLNWTYKGNISQSPEYMILSSEVESTSVPSAIPPEGYGSLYSSDNPVMTVDYVRVYQASPVPEPSTFVMLLIGIALLISWWLGLWTVRELPLH